MAAAVDATNFITASSASHEAFKTANLLKTLTVNAYIHGEKGTGKKTLARYILPHAPIIDAADYDALSMALQSNSEVIITHIEKSPNIIKLGEQINEHDTRVIATGSSGYSHALIEELFSVQLFLPALHTRPEDVTALAAHFQEEAREIFGTLESLRLNTVEPDLSENALSLRRQLFLHLLMQNVSEKEMMSIMEQYLSDKLGSNNDYRVFLHLYEVPLIRAGLKRFKSQLQLSDRLGLNRNTLRKKISENKEYGLDE